MSRREFSNRVRAEIVHRAMNGRGQVTCEGCGQVLALKAYEIDHKIAEALVVDKSKPLTADDGQLLGYCCHRGEDGKTAKDVRAIAKAKRREGKHFGFAPKISRPMPGSRASKFKKRMDGSVVLRGEANS